MKRLVIVAILGLAFSCKTVNKGKSALSEASPDTSKYRCWNESGQSNETRDTLLVVYAAFAEDYKRKTSQEPANCDALTNHIATGQDVYLDLSGRGLQDDPLQAAFTQIANIMTTVTVAGVNISGNNLAKFNPFYIKGVNKNVIYMNLSNNKYALDFNNFVSKIDLSKLMVLDFSGNSFNGDLEPAGSDLGRMPSLIYLNAKGNKLTRLTIDDLWPSIKILDLSNQASASFQLAVYDANLQLDLVHLGLSGGKIFEPSKLNTKFTSIGSADLSRIVLAQDSSLSYVGSFLDIRGSSMIINPATKYKYIWRDKCDGVASCEQTSAMPIGGCPAADLINSLATAITEGETVGQRVVTAADIAAIRESAKAYEPFCKI